VFELSKLVGVEGNNCYQILGLTRDATPDEIRAAYFESARNLHPDVNPVPEAREQFLLVQKAYEVLSNPAKREEYDAKLPPVLSDQAVSINVRYSRSALMGIHEPQLVYALLEIVCTAKPEVERVIPVNVCLVLDCSTSMKGERLDMVKASAVQVLRKLKPQDMISVVTFNDRAEVVIPITRVVELSRLEQRISMLQTGGGTEIFRGLDAAVSQLQIRGGFTGSMLRHLILLTDGHTYGDEENCYRLAQKAGEDGIIFNALGIGSDWNDEFLDHLTSLTNGNTVYVTSLRDMEWFLQEKINSVSNIYARGIALDFNSDPETAIRYAFRLSPETGPLSTTSPINLGNLQYNRHLAVLFEFYIPKLSQRAGKVKLADGVLKLQIPSQKGITHMALHIDRMIAQDIPPELPPANIVEAMAKLTLYRLQERARTEVEAGDVRSATKHLQYLATHLLSNGNRELAHAVLIEAEHIKQSKQFSREGDKKIKYGTRALLLPSGREIEPI
jgi:Ca-activated chloride channel homolog